MSSTTTEMQFRQATLYLALLGSQPKHCKDPYFISLYFIFVFLSIFLFYFVLGSLYFLCVCLVC